MHVDVAPTAETLCPAGLAERAVLVVDVLRASTTIVTALANGCAGVVPVPDPETARRRLADAPGALVAGERRGEPLAGFDLGNSPLEFTPERVGGRTVIFTTSNGTRALLAARAAAAVAVAALVNLGAAAAWARAQGRDITVACAGERGARSLEDWVCAGLLAERLADAAGVVLSEAGREAVVAARPYAGDVGRLGMDSAWALHLHAAGRGEDVAACLRVDTLALVPVYRADVDRIVRGCG